MKHTPPPHKGKPKGKPPGKSDAALKGLKSAGKPPSAPPYKQPPPTDPTKILRDAIKAKEVEALAQEAARYP